MKIKSVIILFSLIVMLAHVSACDRQKNKTDSKPTRTITDMFGREVVIPLKVERIITLGSGGPRIAAYLNVIDMLAASEEYNVSNFTVRRDYNPVYHEKFKTLPIAGRGGGSGNNNGFPEEIIALAPDVIIAAFNADAANELQAQTGIPVVSVRHSTGLAHESFYRAVRIFADVVGAQERAEKLLTAIDAYKKDLNERTLNIPHGDKPKVYAGAVTFNGRRGFAGTYSNFGILTAINARNMADEAGIDGFYEVDLEKVIVWDPDVIFLDPGNMDLVNAEYAVNPRYFASLRAVREGEIYSMPAFNFAGTNITYALINAYYAGIVLFPEQFADVDLEKKAAEILTLFLGENTFDIMAEHGLYYGKISLP